jgi:hypothetical protein
MKVFPGLVVAVSAISNRIEEKNAWPGNDNARYCGCNFVLDPEVHAGPAGTYINSTCTLSFPFAPEDPHFVSVASAYVLGRDRITPGNDVFKFTGFDQVSNPDVLDILVFYEPQDCLKPGRTLQDIDDLKEQGRDSEIWEVFQNDTSSMCEIDLKCFNEPGDQPPPGVYLGNFNYDIARSVQTYTVPVYGLEQAETVTFEIVDYNNKDNWCHNATSHEGHGIVQPGSCSPSNETCGNKITYQQNEEHFGLLEYFQFEPVSPVNSPGCWDSPLHKLHEYKWQTPSPWDTQENFVQPPRDN